ncbi:MAG: FIG015547: peptidase, M16 family [uncultured Thiotrichaceae bacterium]|uniref:FIG015547: peptidase, M16 family n=1 Tax=uncultured Thiotrichaceae bacterium TaxID=298394 RepID=A0A6S6UAW1_9GAMM|nr:MAG: FIG015547: peptidase, M16 family [uncultured Thiotrichaceae bacterium]
MRNKNASKSGLCLQKPSGQHTLRALGRALTFSGVLFCGVAAADSGATNKVPVHEYELDNGLKVLVKQDNRAPIAVVQLWYKVGSGHEHSGITGVSHVLEHMMFKGTEKYPTGEFNRIIGENGAQDNAFTSTDYTAYYQVLASDRIEVAMELESDRMRGLTLPPAEFKKEVEVVKEERRWRTEDKPNALTREQFMSTAFQNSPYGQPVVGWMTDLDNMQVEDLQAWYERWYAPNNATLVVVGDVQPAAIYALANKYYGDIKPSDIVAPKPRKETPQRGLRKVQVKAPAEVPYVMMGFKTPALIDLVGTDEAWEPYALEVLSSVLDGGSSSRMTKEMIRGKEIAAAAAAWYSGYGRLPNLFTLIGVPAKDVDIQVVKDALLEQVERFKTEPVTKDELARVKAQVIAGEVFELDNVQQQATLLGSLESVGLGHKIMDDYVEKILAITPEQIQQVAKKYFVEDQLTIAELDPQPIDPNKSRNEPRFAR